VSARAAQLRAHRLALIERSQALRRDLEGDVKSLGTRLELASAVVTLVRAGGGKALLAGAAALLLSGRSRRLIATVRRARALVGLVRPLIALVTVATQRWRK
jgi:hypothetical protein